MNISLEIISVVLNLTFLIFLLREKKICWLFGIVGSMVSIYLFYITKLYSESVLYVYYVIMGFYGYYLWDKNNENENLLKISKWSLSTHIYLLTVGLILAILLGYYFDNYTNAEESYLDAFTTIFSFAATYLQAKKVLSSWIFWIVLNGLSIYLYITKGLNIYALLALVYFIISFFGYLEWKRKYSYLQYLKL